MPIVVVDVMPKPELLDPQGQAVLAAVAALGHDAITGVRIGKRIEVEVAGEVDDGVLDRVRELSGTLLSNPVIEDFAVRVAPTASA